MTTNLDVTPGIYRHYKANRYEVLMTGVHTETQERLVVYKGLDAPYAVWVRPEAMFKETVEVNGRAVPRFEQELPETA